ncbi:HlyD family efflux transporter periplasmic adaptor subunit [Robbsia sp. Bb-Pol-6]|uniref:HlyD family efflux transporter periplasmic adaptor subunit n=1 Tax=Robbsia betulipollinis TaxID=2981849 RepID=A0ABT3ZRW3_9BURK|nr:HlyD family efflux transporter periplasmic adaptor subunit [Robbsia betulipollinis]
MPPSGFREKAREGQYTPMIGGIMLVRPVSFTLFTCGALGMALLVVLLFVLGSYTRRIRADGVVSPSTGLVKVYVPQSGVVLNKSVTEGQHVTRGMALYRISLELQSAADGHTQAALIEQARQRKQSLLQEIDKTRVLQRDERGTQQARRDSLNTELARLDDRLAAQRQRVALAADGVVRYQSLLAKDYISTDQFQQRQADLLDQQSKLLDLRRDRSGVAQSLKEIESQLSGLTLRQQNDLARIARGVIDVDQTLIETEAKRELVVTAPESGVATAAIAEPGQMVDVTHPVASIVPDSAGWQAFLFVPSTAIGFVRVGDPVRIRYQAYPYVKFGQYRAHVVSVTRTALPLAELSSSGMVAANLPGDKMFYRVTAALDAQTVNAYGRPQPLQAGMSLQADIQQDRRRLYEWVLDSLYSLTGKL